MIKGFHHIKILPLFLAVMLMLTGCGMGIDYTLPDNPIEFRMGTYVNPDDPDDTYGSIEYNGRTYVAYGTQKGNITGFDLGDCLGYIVQGGEKLEDTRVFLLKDDSEMNYLGDFSTNTFMNPPLFFRAVDTIGKDIKTPAYIDSLGYDLW